MKNKCDGIRSIVWISRPVQVQKQNKGRKIPDRKPIALLIIAVLALSLLSGCKGKELDSTDETDNTDKTDNTEQLVDEPSGGTTIENYERLEFGMTYNQVCEILGREGQKLETYLYSGLNIQDAFIWPISESSESSAEVGIQCGFNYSGLVIKARHGAFDTGAEAEIYKIVTYQMYYGISLRMTFEEVVGILRGELYDDFQMSPAYVRSVPGIEWKMEQEKPNSWGFLWIGFSFKNSELISKCFRAHADIDLICGIEPTYISLGTFNKIQLGITY